MSSSESSVQTVNIAEVIENSAVTRLHMRVFVLCAACMIMDGFDVQALGYVAPALIQDWKIAPSLLGPVFGATNLGILIGQLTFTMIADKVGRRPVLISGAILFACLTIVTGFAQNITQLLLIRFIAGMALGSIIPNAIALVGEYSPIRLRVMLTTYIGIGYTAGAMLGGFVAAAMIPVFGWRSIFYLGGAIPLVLALLMYVWLPESLQLLVLRKRPLPQLHRWLGQLGSVTVAQDTRYVVPEENKSGVPVLRLFEEGRRNTTLLLWVINFMNLLNLYSLSNWLPTVVKSSGYSTSTAVLIGTMLQVGGTVSPFLFAWLIFRYGFKPVLTSVFGIATIAIALIGHLGFPLIVLIVLVTIAGACIVGGQPSINALSATYYPTYLRSTGLGWSLGIGRSGAIVGPVLAGQFIALQWTSQSIFLALAIPALLSAIAMLFLQWTMTPDRSQSIPRAASAI